MRFFNFKNLIREKVEISRDSAAEILRTNSGEFVPENITIFPEDWEALAESNFGNLDLLFESQEDFARKTLEVLLAIIFPDFEIQKKGEGYSVDTTNKIGGDVCTKIKFEEGKRFRDGAFSASFWVEIFSRQTPRSANKLRFSIEAKPKKS